MNTILTNPTTAGNFVAISGLPITQLDFVKAEDTDNIEIAVYTPHNFYKSTRHIKYID